MTQKQVFPIKSDTGCLLKWAWSTVYLGQGTTSSCHRTDQFPIDPDNFANFHNQLEKLSARRLMQAGGWPQAGCQYCEKIEAAGGMSDRQYQLHAGHDQDRTPQELLKNPNAVEVIPTILEIYFNNTCNMSCLYCGPHFSSQWADENRKYGLYEKGPVKFGWFKEINPQYEKMLADFWKYLTDNDRYLHIRQYQIAGGEPFYQKEFEQSLEFWEQHPNPNLTFNMITNLKVAPKKFQAYIDRFGRMVEQGHLKRLQISSSLDCWGPQQEYVRWGLDLTEWQENFEYLLDKPWVQQCINSAITPLTIKTLPELILRMNFYNDHLPAEKQISYSFMTVMAPNWMDPAIFGAGVFDQDFERILEIMRVNTLGEKSAKEHMMGIGRQISQAPRNLTLITGLKDYLSEIDRRRNTDWRKLFPWLDQDWK
jgi:hypothetical protein